jgi:hypothetical protein
VVFVVVVLVAWAVGGDACGFLSLLLETTGGTSLTSVPELDRTTSENDLRNARTGDVGEITSLDTAAGTAVGAAIVDVAAVFESVDGNDNC